MIEMKELLKRTFVVASIMIAVVFFVSYLMIGATQEIVLVFELFLLAFLVVVIQYAMKSLFTGNYFINISMEYLAISGCVLLFGYYVGWFIKANWWMVFLYVAAVYIPAYFFDVCLVKRDVDYINTELKKRWEDAEE